MQGRMREFWFFLTNVMTTRRQNGYKVQPLHRVGFYLAARPIHNQLEVMHVVPISPWPFITATSIMFLLLSILNFFRYVPFSSYFIFISLVLFILALLLWSSDVVLESVELKMHTLLMQRSFSFAIILFIVSEVMFFFSFFWAFFHYSLSPSIFIYGIWPPIGISVISPWAMPLLNTAILLTSGVSLTVAHRAFMFQGLWRYENGIRKSVRPNQPYRVMRYLFLTIILGFFFTVCQLFEYMNCSFSINDSVYGSVFFLTTGFHGLHVIVGTIFLVIALYRFCYKHFGHSSIISRYQIGLDLAIWYWHFVDVVWLFLFVAVYWWGS